MRINPLAKFVKYTTLTDRKRDEIDKMMDQI